jgi:hypothetical protein
VDTVACQQATRGKRQSQRSRPCDRAAEHARLRCRVGWWGACGWGSGMPAPSGQIPSTLGADGDRGSGRESCVQLVPGSGESVVAGNSECRDLTLCMLDTHGRVLSGPGGLPECRGLSGVMLCLGR